MEAAAKAAVSEVEVKKVFGGHRDGEGKKVEVKRLHTKGNFLT